MNPHLVKITEETSDSYHIVFSERQMYGPEIWEKCYIKRFKDLRDAVKYVLDNSDNSERALENMKYDFSAVRKIGCFECAKNICVCK